MNLKLNFDELTMLKNALKNSIIMEQQWHGNNELHNEQALLLKLKRGLGLAFNIEENKLSDDSKQGELNVNIDFGDEHGNSRS